MGLCYGKNISVVVEDDSVGYSDDLQTPSTSTHGNEASRGRSSKNTRSDTPTRSSNSSWRSAWHRSSGTSPLPQGSSQSPARSSVGFSRRPFPPSSPEKLIKALSAKRFGSPKPKRGPIPADGAEVHQPLLDDKNFGYSKNFTANYELGKEIGRGHFGHTCSAKAKNGELQDQPVAVKIISKAKMTTPISIQDVHREVKILRALSEGHQNLVKFYDACEDADNVYMVMELCEGERLLDRILSRGGRYKEEDAKVIVVQILSVVAYCHLQGVVHRDLKPENFLFTTRDEDAPMKLIDFGLSDFVRPDDERFNDIVGSAYYVAPEVLRRSHSTEADIWSIGIITFVLLSGRTPFWARTESQIFRAILRGGPNYDNAPWPLVSPEAKSFVQRLLHKSYRKRMTAAQALTHPWLKGITCSVPLDTLAYKLVKSYLEATPLRRAALRALSKALTEDELVYLKAQYMLLKSHKDDVHVSLENFKMALMKNATDVMKESKISDILITMEEQFSHVKLDFEEFCAAAISTYQLEALENWEPMVNEAFEYFELVGNRAVTVDELAWELNLSRASHSMLNDWIRCSDGKLSFLGYTKYLHGVTAFS